MRKFMKLFVLTGLVFFALSTDLNAQIFVKFENPDIQGESTAPDHEKWVVFSSFNFGVATPQNPNSGSMRQAGAAQLSAVNLTKAFDRSSVPLLESAAMGKRVGRVVIHLTKSSNRGASTYLEVVLHDASFAHYEISSGGNRPTESFVIEYNRIEVKHLDSNKHPIYQFGWDKSKAGRH